MDFIREIIRKYASDSIFIYLTNLNSRLKKRNSIARVYKENIYEINDGSKTIYTPRRSRFGRYAFGINKQCKKLSKDYLLNNITFQPNDIVIDCGANNGEIGIWANSKNLKYYAFEPETLEAECCDLNNYNGDKKTIRKGLWFEETTIHWHSKPESADSSIIEINDTENITSIQTTTLDSFVKSEKINNIKLFKLEAEGAEPEVLKGALNVLNQIDYIAVDCGYERGIEKSHTFIEIYKILTENNFEIIDAKFKRVVFLFKRKNA